MKLKANFIDLEMYRNIYSNNIKGFINQLQIIKGRANFNLITKTILYLSHSKNIRRFSNILANFNNDNLTFLDSPERYSTKKTLPIISIYLMMNISHVHYKDVEADNKAEFVLKIRTNK